MLDLVPQPVTFRLLRPQPLVLAMLGGKNASLLLPHIERAEEIVAFTKPLFGQIFFLYCQPYDGLIYYGFHHLIIQSTI
jgi:hypothetical protein